MTTTTHTNKSTKGTRTYYIRLTWNDCPEGMLESYRNRAEALDTIEHIDFVWPGAKAELITRKEAERLYGRARVNTHAMYPCHG